MFRRLHDEPASQVQVTVDGRLVNAQQGDTVAAVLAAAGLTPTRTTAVSGAPRSAYCMMGICFDCLVTVDGVGNRQGCLVPVAAGMVIERQDGRRETGR
jgi:predicted molibdopterin-dependent oxidoreductase YjgC